MNAAGVPRQRKRAPDQTRLRLLQAAFAEIHRNGFRSASLDEILKAAGVTKGALYHHFENKTALGYAVVDELIRSVVEQTWVKPLEAGDDPIQTLAAIRRNQPPGVPVALLGCPVNNLAQEMSPLDEGFRKRIEEVFDLWRGAIAGAFRRGRDAGILRSGIDPDSEALFFLASMEGAIGMAKNAQDPAVLDRCLDVLEAHVESLRA